MSDSDQEAFRSYGQDLTQVEGPIHKQQPLIIRITQPSHEEQMKPFYNKDTFKFQLMFLKVTQHHKQFQHSRYDDTMQNNTASMSMMTHNFSYNKNQSRGENILDELQNNSWVEQPATSQNKIQEEENEHSGQNDEESNKDEKEQFNQIIPQQELNLLNQVEDKSIHQQAQNESKIQGEQNNELSKQNDKVQQVEDEDDVIMELDMSNIQGSQSFSKKLDASFSASGIKISLQDDYNEGSKNENIEEEDEQEQEEMKLTEEEIKARMQKLEGKEMERLIIKFKYENCSKVNIKCITHGLMNGQIKPKKMEATDFLRIDKRKFNLSKPNSNLEMQEIGQSKIPIQIIMVTLGCNECRTGINKAYSSQNTFTCICRNQECMKPIYFEILEIHPS